MTATEINTIVVSRTDKIGDLVLSIPSFVKLRKMYPNARIIVLARSYNAPIIEGLSSIDEVILVDKLSFFSLIKKLRALKIDAFIALFSDTFVANVAMFSGAHLRIGPFSKLMSWFVYNMGIRQKRSQSTQNEAEYNLDLIRVLDSELYETTPLENEKIFYDSNNKEVVERFIKEKEVVEPFVLCHPFTGGSAKNLTLEEYAQVINTVHDKDNSIPFVISCAKADEDNANYLVSLLKNKDKVKIFVSEGSILDLCALIDRADLYIGGSTGPSHLAGNLKKKCIVVYPNKPTQSPTRWGLYLNKENTTYVIPDKDSVNEDYSHNYFDNVTDNIIDKFANTIIAQFKG